MKPGGRDDLRLAPPPHRLNSPASRPQWAVPIDMQRTRARLVFDTRAQTVAGEATVDFQHGIERGFPLFDLRQPIRQLRLDGGAALSAATAELRRFGTRRDQSLRVLRRPLAAGSKHRLQIAYSLHAPPLAASPRGGYQPELRWGPTGGTVDFNFGFTDLGGGRYLEAWVPSNLLYDRFALRLEVEVRHTQTPHVLITNGTVQEAGRNHWRVEYPDTFTTCSPMLQLHPAASVEQADQTIAFPDGRPLRIEAWKFRDTTAVDLAEQLTLAAGWLRRNDAAIGPYLHGERFLAFLHRGGMEYDGACTAAPDALEHEIFHSWWARGVKPASQNDGWIDEAWTVYHDDGGNGREPFDFAEPPLQLAPRTPWNRATPVASYRLGARFFRGLAHRLGVGELHELMREFYLLRAPGLITTGQLEAHLLDRTQDDIVARAFERWVWGRNTR